MPHGCGEGPSTGRLSGPAARRAIQDAMAVVPIVVSKIELWKPEQLIPLEQNPRLHSDQQIGEIAASMREFGFLWPIMVDGKTRRIVAGNGRYLAAVRLGLPVVVARRGLPRGRSAPRPAAQQEQDVVPLPFQRA